MKINKPIVLLFLASLLMSSCQKDFSYLKELDDPEWVQSNVKNLTDIIVYDIFSPPVASRVYLYPTIAAYQTMQLANLDSYASLVGQVKGLEPLPANQDEDVNYTIASFDAFNTDLGTPFSFNFSSKFS